MANATNTNQFWQAEASKVKAAQGRGGIVLIAPASLKPNGKVLVEDDQTVKGTVIEASGMTGIEPGKEYTFHLSEAAVKGIDKGVPETGASSVALLGVTLAGNSIEARHAAVVGDGRMAPMPKKKQINGIEVYDKIVEPVTVFAKVGKSTRAFQAHNATPESIAALESALQAAGKGVLVKKNASSEERRKARMECPVGVQAVMYNPSAAKLLDSRSADDPRSENEVIMGNLGKLKEYTENRPSVKFAFRAFLSDAKGNPSYDPAHVAFHRPKFDPEKGYTVANESIAALAEQAEKLGMTLRVEAIPYMTMNASGLTDGSYEATAIVIAKRQLELATSNDDVAAAYRTLTRRAGFAPAMVLSTIVTDKETGEVHPGVLLREPERLDGGYASLKQMATGNFDGSKVTLTMDQRRADDDESQTSASASRAMTSASAPVGGTETDENEFDAASQPGL